MSLRRFQEPLADNFGTSDLLQQLVTSFFGDDRPLLDKHRNVCGRSLMKIDTSETEDAFHVSVDLPGVNKEDVKVYVDKDGPYVVLNIEAERKEERMEETEKSHFRERSYGHCSRKVYLPKHADASKTSCQFRNGVLKVSVQKLPEDALKGSLLTIDD